MGQPLGEERTEHSEQVQRPSAEVFCSRNSTGVSGAGVECTRDSPVQGGVRKQRGPEVVRPPITRTRACTRSEMGPMTKR